jgi:hypothetical protein
LKTLFTTLLLATCSLAQIPAPTPTVAQLVGTWQLLSIEDTMKDGAVNPPDQFGPHPRGFLMYHPDGHMCASIMNPDRPAWKDPAKATDAEKITYYDTFIAYCGTYKLNAQRSVVTHYPSVAWTPSYVGSTQARPFKIQANRLIITVANPLPAVAKRILVWERAPGQLGPLQFRQLTTNP